jgi:hypothetical protein
MSKEIPAMSADAQGTFVMNSWDEKPFSEIEGERKLSVAEVTNTYSGAIEGEGVLRYLLNYLDAKTATYVGMEHVTGKVGDRSGSFVLQQEGKWSDGAATGTWSVIPGSGTGELRGLKGSGGYTARHGDHDVSYTFEYEIE